ncbi:TetR/AcrR family transcriptional regulator [Mycobacteroides franklinii]|uniref:TetR/AcrR family transcriptional regulator n=1 Tax=Mycobacteroides franklinii TaxID=948102 RepID=UPI000991D8D1|nr:TetR/AcrR family transcriptional regulator [Mycobacteroides franklinii]
MTGPRQSLDPAVLRIFEAALEQFAVLGISRTSLTDIARRANVDRGTIYRRVGDLRAVTGATLAFEGQRLVDQIRADIEPFGDLSERFERAFVGTVQLMRNHPILVRALEVDRAAALLAIADVTPMVMSAANAFVLDEIHGAQRKGHTVPIQEQVLAGLAVRLVHSLVIFPDAPPVLKTDEELADYVRTNFAALLPIAGGLSATIGVQ